MHRRKIGFFILAFIILGALSFFAMPYLRPSPEVVRPPNLESLDPAMAALIRTKADESEARSHDASAHGELGMVYEANLFGKRPLHVLKQPLVWSRTNSPGAFTAQLP
ncbi:MAG: hypothetical protein L0229_00470 [Blastocatellia bacterium]|nr:hypothetical protein [Blastocatellia bacterium]